MMKSVRVGFCLFAVCALAHSLIKQVEFIHDEPKEDDNERWRNLFGDSFEENKRFDPWDIPLDFLLS